MHHFRFLLCCKCKFLGLCFNDYKIMHKIRQVYRQSEPELFSNGMMKQHSAEVKLFPVVFATTLHEVLAYSVKMFWCNVILSSLVSALFLSVNCYCPRMFQAIYLKQMMMMKTTMMKKKKMKMIWPTMRTA